MQSFADGVICRAGRACQTMAPAQHPYRFFPLACGCGELLLEQTSHEPIAVAVRMDAVVSQLRLQLTGRPGQFLVIVDETQSLARCVLAQPDVEILDDRRRFDLRPPG